jgi:hypothetical protein
VDHPYFVEVLVLGVAPVGGDAHQRIELVTERGRAGYQCDSGKKMPPRPMDTEQSAIKTIALARKNQNKMRFLFC